MCWIKGLTSYGDCHLVWGERGLELWKTILVIIYFIDKCFTVSPLSIIVRQKIKQTMTKFYYILSQENLPKMAQVISISRPLANKMAFAVNLNMSWGPSIPIKKILARENNFVRSIFIWLHLKHFKQYLPLERRTPWTFKKALEAAVFQVKGPKPLMLKNKVNTSIINNTKH